MRIRYAGTGEQAWKSLHTLVKVVGELDGSNETVKKHIKEASVAEEVVRRVLLVRWVALAAPVAACGSGHGTPDVVPPPVTVEAARPPDVAPAVECVDEPGMIYIPGGDYRDKRDDRTARLAGFWIDRTEVTVAAYRAFVASGRSPPYDKPSTCNWNFAGGDELPINCIDWYQAEAYCLWSRKRLPSMDEWVWAAEGREERRHYPWGDAPASCELAVVDVDRSDTTRGCGRERAWPVGSKPTDVTRDGVLDMLGNVGEVTATGTSVDPKSTRYHMGASWATNPGPEPIALDRFPNVHEAYSDNSGVRCVKDIGSKPPCAPLPANIP